MEGRPALCETAPQYSGAGTLASGGIRFRLRGAPVHHYVGVAAFAEKTVMMRRSLVKIEADVPTDAAALIGCAVLTGAGAVFNTARVRPGEAVVGSIPAANVSLPIMHAGVVAEERTINGSYFGSSVPVRDVPRFARMVRDGQLPVGRIADRRIGLGDLNAAFDALADGKSLRQILVPSL